MKNSRLISRILLISIVIVFAAGVSQYVKAQKGDAVIQYLQERFKQENIPIRHISVLSESPLRLQIVIQAKGKSVTSSDASNFHLVDRDVFIFAREQDYFVDSYVRILADPQGGSIDTLVEPSKFKFISVNTSPTKLSDDKTLKLLKEKIKIIIDRYNLGFLSITAADISSYHGFQTFAMQVKVPSLEATRRAILLAGPMYPMLREVNAQGAQIAVYHLWIKNMEGSVLVDYYFDLQLQNESWRVNGLNLSDEFPEPAPALMLTATP